MSTDPYRSGPLLPPVEPPRHRQLAPLSLLIVGLAGMAVVASMPRRVRPASAATTAPAVEAAAAELSQTLAALLAAEPIAPEAARRPAATSADAPVIAPPPAAPRAVAILPAGERPADARADAARALRLESILLGSRGRRCLINGRPYAVGDTARGFEVRSIGRTSVVVRCGDADYTLHLATSR